MTTTTTRALAGGLLSVALLAGCSNDPGPGEQSSSSTSGSESTSAPASASPSESSSQTGASPTQGDPSTSPSASSADPTSIYPHGTPHEDLEEGRQEKDGKVTPPDHVVATDAYRDAEDVIRAYTRNMPVKTTKPGFPTQVHKYITDEYQRSESGDQRAYQDGRYVTMESKILSVEPYNWTTQGVDTVTLDACSRTETHLYEADGTEYKNLDRQGNKVDPVEKGIVRYHLDSHDQGRSWKISAIEYPGRPC